MKEILNSKTLAAKNDFSNCVKLIFMITNVSTEGIMTKCLFIDVL